MRIVMFYHSLVSDWNHGNAHFLRGIATELMHRGHEVLVYEPQDGWSRMNLVTEQGHKPLRKFEQAYPRLHSLFYWADEIDLDEALSGADLVLVHEWNDPTLVKRIGQHRALRGGYTLLFHDTHHRMVTAPESMAAYDLRNYDGVLAYGKILQELYAGSGRVKSAWTWHEAADTRVFRPFRASVAEGHLVWVGNWGDGERTAEIQEFLIEPVKNLGLQARIHGVRYPLEAIRCLADARIEYAGWVANFDVPKVFSRFLATIHIPRQPYTKALSGIPTIRVFEAMACGIPLVCSWWEDCEGLFGSNDFLVARNGREMIEHLRTIFHEPDFSASLAQNALKTIQSRHTCAHRVDELLAIVKQIRGG